jgi:energy-coupling factor transporter ATP-binding protein EcfA2
MPFVSRLQFSTIERWALKEWGLSMLKSLRLKNFTVFADADFQLGKQLNVVVGENGLGKTHVLKAAYCVLAVSSRGERESGSAIPTKTYLQTALASKLRGVFRPDEIGRLARRQAGRNRAEIDCFFAEQRFDVRFSFDTSSKTEVRVDHVPSGWITEVPVYLPTRELLTIHPGFVGLYETTRLPFEETWRDTAILLDSPLARGRREAQIGDLLAPLEEAMEGKVELDESGRFYLRTSTGRFEAHLVAEGLRKLAMIARLIATGSLLDKGYLFWDEPEANLNPKLIKLVARTIFELGLRGIQVFIATHSLFLLRELSILKDAVQYSQTNVRFFGLHSDGARGVRVQQGDAIDDIGDITALEEELRQSERYLEPSVP